jgi:hypothetical protein
MNRKLRGATLLLLFTALALGTSFSTALAVDDWKDPHANRSPEQIQKLLKHNPTLKPHGIDVPTPKTTNVVDRDVLNLRALLGGGRKLSRHDCPEGPDNLEAVYTRDVGHPDMTLWNGLSRDNGVTWNPVGPLSFDPTQYRDRSHCISYADVTYLGYQEAAITGAGNSLKFFTKDVFGCLQAFPTPTQVGDEAMGLDEYYLQQVVVPMNGSYTIYWSFIDFNAGNPYTTYFRKSTDGGMTWSGYLNFTDDVATPNGFQMSGMDGPLMMDADGDWIAALASVVLDSAWAAGQGLAANVAYPAFTQSFDGGDTWSDLELIWGTNAADYPHGHSGDPALDDSIHYSAGMGFGAAYTAFNNIQDNCVITPDGKVHMTYQLEDATFGYEAVFHTVYDNGTFEHAFVGVPEEPGRTGQEFMPSIARTDGNAVVIGWTEFQATGAGDIYVNPIPAGQVEGTGPINVSQSADDETYQRIVDRVVPVSEGSEDFYVDWIFEFYGEGGSSADSTLWHLQTTVTIPGGAGIGDDNGGPGAGLPRVAALSQNFPNPFNPSTSINYEVPTRSQVSIKIYDVRGRLVQTLVNDVREAGSYSVQWNGRDSSGEQVSSGIYLYTMETDGHFKTTKKMVLLK